MPPTPPPAAAVCVDNRGTSQPNVDHEYWHEDCHIIYRVYAVSLHAQGLCAIVQNKIDNGPTDQALDASCMDGLRKSVQIYTVICAFCQTSGCDLVSAISDLIILLKRPFLNRHRWDETYQGPEYEKDCAQELVDRVNFLISHLGAEKLHDDPEYQAVGRRIMEAQGFLMQVQMADLRESGVIW